MGQSSSKPKNKTGKNVVKLKTDTACKTGVLSLREHDLSNLPEQIYEIGNLRVLDLSKNKLKRLPNRMGELTSIKSLNVNENKIIRGSLIPLSKLDNLQTLSLSNNRIGLERDGERTIVGPHLPTLSAKLKSIKIDHNHLTSIPKSIYAPALTKLEKIDLSFNQIAVIPQGFCESLASCLMELNLDNNLITSLPTEMGALVNLKSLSLQSNKIVVLSTTFDARNPQPLPEELFTKTPLIDLNLKGNRMTNGQLNEFKGVDLFLERRARLKSKNINGGALTDLDVCGLE